MVWSCTLAATTTTATSRPRVSVAILWGSGIPIRAVTWVFAYRTGSVPGRLDGHGVVAALRPDAERHCCVGEVHHRSYHSGMIG